MGLYTTIIQSIFYIFVGQFFTNKVRTQKNFNWCSIKKLKSVKNLFIQSRQHFKERVGGEHSQINLENLAILCHTKTGSIENEENHCHLVRYCSTGHQLKGNQKFMLNLCTNHTSTMKPHFVMLLCLRLIPYRSYWSNGLDFSGLVFAASGLIWRLSTPWVDFINL